MDDNLQLKEDIGAYAEERLFAAFETVDPDEPEWFLGVRPSTTLLDMRGIDAIATVRYKDSRVPVDIPLQIKTSERYIDDYYAKHPLAHKAGVIVFVIWRAETADSIRKRLFTELKFLRRERRRYDEFFEQVNRCPPKSERGRMLWDKIEKRKGIAAPAAELPRVPRHQMITFLPVVPTRKEALYDQGCRLLAKVLSM